MLFAKTSTKSGLDKARLSAIVSGFAGKRVAVLGDAMLDIFTYGANKRISAEVTLVPVFKTEHEEYIPGGAANVAANAAALGGSVQFHSRIGKDDEGRTLARLLTERGVGIGGLHQSDRVPTSRKHRLLATDTQMIRFDREETTPPSPEEVEEYLQMIIDMLPAIDALAIADYRKGFITEDFITRLLSAAEERNIPVVVDTKVDNAGFYRGKHVSLITPNSHEAFAMTNTNDALSAGTKLREYFGFPVLVTRGRKGMMLFAQNGEMEEFPPTHTVAAVDVNGAGDTVIAVVALALASGATLSESVALGNYAGGIVVAKPGTAVLSAEELLQRIND